MHAHYGIVPAQYHMPVQWHGRQDELWDEMQPLQQQFPIHQEVKTIYRYLSEPDQPWFIPRTREDGSLDMIYQPPYTNPPDIGYQEPSQYPQPVQYQYTSPGSGYLSSPSTYSGSNDSRSISSSPPRTPQYSPEVAYHDSCGVPFGGVTGIKQGHPRAGECVALTEIQTYADAVADEDKAFESETPAYYLINVQEGYQPMRVGHDHPSGTYTHNDAAVPAVPAERRADGPHFRRRQAPESRSISSTGSRVGKRSSTRKRSTIKSEPDTYTNHTTTSNSRAFPCPFALYGCPSSFGSKNEWKRHINTQHMRLTYWRCDLCDQTSRRPNDFNRKDLFIQHVRRMHPKTPTISTNSKPTKKSSLHTRPSKNDPYEQELIAIAHRCFQNTRPSPDQTGCLFCEDKFAGQGSWDDRLEHIGKHMELAKKGQEGFVAGGKASSTMLNWRYWRPDPELEQWLEEEDIIVHDGQGFVLADDVRA